MQQTLATLSKGRISIGALALGLAQAAYDASVAYAKQRRTFGAAAGQPPGDPVHGGRRRHRNPCRALDALLGSLAQGHGRHFATAAGMAKLFATEVSERVCRNAIQIHGGYGYSQEYEVERMYRDTRLMSIGEGTSEIQRMIIARTIFGH